MADFEGIIIEESLADKSVLGQVEIIAQKVESVTDAHKTPWLTKWTMDTVAISADKANDIAKLLSRSIDKAHAASWYVDFKNDTYHYVVYSGKVFLIDRSRRDQYQEAAEYGVSIGIPEYQVDLSSYVTEWRR